MHVKLAYILLVVFFKGVLLFDSCRKHETCHDCIRDSSVCVWCSKESYNKDRCMAKNSENRNVCEEHNIEKADNYKKTVKNGELSAEAGYISQIKPQQYDMKLRAGEPLEFTFFIAAVENYPVDVYFLIDSSHSMKSFVEGASKQARNIYSTLYNATKDVYLGIGQFVDKNVLPFNLNVTDNTVYSFKNTLKLNPDFEKFEKVLRNFSGVPNRDQQEGTLDALAQAMACGEDIIGWRPESRKIIILLTDGPFHAAGDGRSAGIFQPYDGECHTDINGIYKRELTMDYPSVKMINKLAKEKEIIVIFVVKDDHTSDYDLLAKEISGAQKQLLQEKSGESQNQDYLVDILKNIYDKLSKYIKLKINKISGHNNNLTITFVPDCTKEGNDACKIVPKQIYDFTANITLPKFIIEAGDKADIDIAVEGISEKLRLKIEIIKDCDCETNGTKHLFCSDEILECGICKCPKTKYGKACQCSIDNQVPEDDTANHCVKDGAECSRIGECSCGTCICPTHLAGKYCECDLTVCPRDKDNAVCGGPGHGKCSCDKKCACNPAWTGEACDCTRSVAHCSDDDGKVCNDHGHCECGECKCDDPAGWDIRNIGPLCVMKPVPDRHRDQCQHLAYCVNCFLDHPEECDCPWVNYEIVDSLEALELRTGKIGTVKKTLEKNWENCTEVAVQLITCYVSFMYMYNETSYGVDLLILKSKNCSQSYLTVCGLVALTIILVGLATMVGWKMLVDYRDRKEYLRFVQEQADPAPVGNPLYRSSMTTVNNPAYRKRSINRY